MEIIKAEGQKRGINNPPPKSPKPSNPPPPQKPSPNSPKPLPSTKN